MQLYAVNFIPLLGSLYMFREQVTVTILWFVPVAVDTVEHCTPEDGSIWRPEHVE